MTYNEARKLAIRELLDEGISAQEFVDAGRDNYEGNLNDMIDALADRILEEAANECKIEIKLTGEAKAAVGTACTSLDLTPSEIVKRMVLERLMSDGFLKRPYPIPPLGLIGDD
jgi:hypothetical protein